MDGVLFEVRSAGVEAGAVRGLQALRATLLTAVEAARDGDLQEAKTSPFFKGLLQRRHTYIS